MSSSVVPGAAQARARSPWLGGWPIFLPILLLAALRGLWAPDEPRYAEVAREAWEGDLLVMHLNGELYPDKPPLVYWIAGLFGKLMAWNELALRLPSLLATLVTAWLAARLARRLWGELEAAWVPFFFLGTPMVLEIGGRLQLDPVLACLCLASVERATDDRGSSTERGRRLALAGSLAGLAALAKGPVAWLHVGVAILALRTARNRERDATGPRWRGWVLFAFLALLPVVTWAALASLRDPRLFGALFFGQHIGRIVDGTQHRGPPWEHLLHFPLYFLPWTPLLVLGCVSAWRAHRRRAGTEDEHERALGSVVLWFALVLTIFSAMPPKRDLYLLPIYPVAALISARALSLLLGGVRRSPWFVAPPALLWIVLGIAGLALGVALPSLSAETVVRLLGKPEVHAEIEDGLLFVLPLRAPLFAVAGCLLLGGVTGLLQWRRSSLGSLQWLGFSLGAAAVAFAIGIAPALDQVKSVRSVAEWLAARPERPSVIPCVGVQPEGYRFYGRLPAFKTALEPALEREGPRFLALISRKEYSRLPEALRARVRPLLERTVGSRDVIVLGAAAVDPKR